MIKRRSRRLRTEQLESRSMLSVSPAMTEWDYEEVTTQQKAEFAPAYPDDAAREAGWKDAYENDILPLLKLYYPDGRGGFDVDKMSNFERTLLSVLDPSVEAPHHSTLASIHVMILSITDHGGLLEVRELTPSEEIEVTMIAHTTCFGNLQGLEPELLRAVDPRFVPKYNLYVRPPLPETFEAEQLDQSQLSDFEAALVSLLDPQAQPPSSLASLSDEELAVLVLADGDGQLNLPTLSDRVQELAARYDRTGQLPQLSPLGSSLAQTLMPRFQRSTDPVDWDLALESVEDFSDEW